MNRKTSQLCAALALAFAALQGAAARVTPAEAEALGKGLTCFGAEKAGNKDGSIPEYTGKWLGAPAGVAYKGAGTINPDPYANEKPLYVVTAANMGLYADKLSDGQKALLQKYPNSYKLPVYPSHRDFRMADWRCDRSRENAVKAEVIDDGLAVKGLRGTAPFPIPKTGLELLWNMNMPARAFQEDATYDQAVVYANGSLAKGRTGYKILSPSNDPAADKGTDGVSTSFYQKTLAPERNKGEIIVGQEYFNNKTNPRGAWQYSPGTRRVRQLPAFGFDMPQGPGGFRTVDDDRLFNGSPERYNWKILGKREMLVPYDAYRIDDPKYKYAELLTPGHLNPEATRYELHRVWVLEAVLKEGFRHQYAKRVLFIDEDSWQALQADNYDSRGQLWRVSMVHSSYDYGAQFMQARVAVFHDLVSGAYMADRLINEAEHPPVLNGGTLKPSMFTAEAAREDGR
ncbi:DUF1329 domain-containing protein [Pelomonas sp. KK5]|uniref:DUF1329 domain-containing protein n=1 Tax=Pelomonas sp. KK5 TaxID=1855730 RepID=UPI00097C11CD|nr:DUF1329 domain-containing protein [Pelomonas sp. KK5]